MRDVTLVFLLRENELLLGMKKRGFGANKWNGLGGKVDGSETVEQAAVREVQEESSVAIAKQDLKYIGSIDFHFDHDSSWDQRAHIYFVRSWKGVPQETDEMLPQWFSLDALPYDKMWIDDKYWLPKALAKETIDATFVFSNKGASIKKMEFR